MTTKENSMTLEEKLRRLKQQAEEKSETNWASYKKAWQDDISKLQNTIVHKWFQHFEEEKLMVLEFVPTKRIEPYIGEYMTMILEINFPNGKSIILDPIAGITSEYSGKLELYLRVNVFKKVSILRKEIPEKDPEWIVAKSFDPADHFRLDKSQLEKIINEWIA